MATVEQIYPGGVCYVCKSEFPQTVVIRYPPGQSYQMGGAQYVHPACCPPDWTFKDGSTVGKEERKVTNASGVRKAEIRNSYSDTCVVCTKQGGAGRLAGRRANETVSSAWVHPDCSKDWMYWSGSDWLWPTSGLCPRKKCGHPISNHNWLGCTRAGCQCATSQTSATTLRAKKEKEEALKVSLTDLKPGKTFIYPGKGSTIAGSLHHWAKPGQRASWIGQYHLHGISIGKLREYFESGKTDGLDIKCYYLDRGYTQSFSTTRFEHDALVEVAKARGVPYQKHVCENVVTREEVVIKEVIVERGASTWKELSFGEAASLTASLQHGQHILNDDLRRAMKADDKEEIDRCQAKLADHMSLMDKLSVQPASWEENYQAMLRAGRVEVDLPVTELSIWS